MTGTIDYFFTSVSPFVYLGHRKLMEIVATHGASLAFRPFALGGVWENSGSVPLPQRSATRQRYRLVELQRIAEFRGETLNLHPAHFPVNPERADLCVIAIAQAGGNPADFLYETCKAVWARNLDISDEAVLADLLQVTGHPAEKMLENSRSQAANPPDCGSDDTARAPGRFCASDDGPWSNALLAETAVLPVVPAARRLRGALGR